jgi:hypothetical protein
LPLVQFQEGKPNLKDAGYLKVESTPGEVNRYKLDM